MFRLHTLGGLYLDRDGVRVVGGVTQRKRLVLLAFLAAESRSGATRDKIASLLWPESDSAHSRNALYQAVAAIRRDLGADVLIGGATGDVRLNDQILTSDVSDFLAALARGDLENAVAVYSGPFLDGVHVRGAADFERWTATMRRACAERYRDALGQLANATATGDARAAVRWLRLLAAADPLDPRAALRLMEALASTGDVDGAIRHGLLHGDLVRNELEDEPDERIGALLTELRRTTERGGLPEAQTSANRPDYVARRAEASLPPSRAVLEPVLERGSATPTTKRRMRLAARSTAVGVMLAAAVGVSAFAIAKPWRTSPRDDKRLDPHRVVVADFENLTGDSSFSLLGAALGDWVTRGVIDAGVATVVDPTSRVTIGRLRDEIQALRGKERALALARASAAGVVVSGAIYREGQKLSIHTQLTDVANDRVVTSLEPITAPVDDGMRSASLVRERVAGALASAFDERLTSITLPSSRPPNYAAYREFMLGLDVFVGLGGVQSLPHFARASELDSTFALPLIWSTFALENAKRYPEADSVIAALAKRRPFLGTLEELQLRVFQATDLDEQLLLSTRAAHLSPGSTWSMNVGAALHNRNRMREAVNYFQQIDPEHGWARTWVPYWLYYSRALHAVGDYDAESRVAKRYRELGGSAMHARFLEARAAVGLGMHGVVLATLGEISAHPRVGCNSAADLYQQLALEMSAHGDSSAADSALSSLISLCQREERRRAKNHSAPDSLRAWIASRVWLGIAMYRTKRNPDAQELLTWAVDQPAIEAPIGELAHAFLGRLAARRGDRAAADREMNAIPRQTSRDEAYWVADRVAIAALLGDRERAVQELQAVSLNFPYAMLHRDADYASLWSFAPFRALATPY